MTKPALDLPLSPRERLRWRRAMDIQLIDAIFGRVVRDEPSPRPLGRPAESVVVIVGVAGR